MLQNWAPTFSHNIASIYGIHGVFNIVIRGWDFEFQMRMINTIIARQQMLASAKMTPFVISLQDVSIQSFKGKMKSNEGKKYFFWLIYSFLLPYLHFCMPVP